VQRSATAPVWHRNKRASPKQVHDVQSGKTLPSQRANERSYLISDETTVPRCDTRTLNVFSFEFHCQSVNACKRIYSFVERMVDHSDRWNLIVQG
jgi:hypothetical protein